jgi:hypothetical protein
MLSRNFIRFLHRIDLYDKVATPNDMGQMKPSWNLYAQSVPCLFVRTGSSTGIRITPTIEETDHYYVYFEHDAPVTYGSRIKNVTTRANDEIVNDGCFQVIGIDREISFTGKIQYLQVKVKSVIE